MKTALITGVLGQDGSYLSEHLLGLGYRVVGLARRSSSSSDWRVARLRGDPNFQVVRGDVTDAFSVCRALAEHRPDEVYNLAAQSQVGESFSQPVETTDVCYVGCLNCLEAIRSLPPSLRPRFYQASSSEMFGSSYGTRLRPPTNEEWLADTVGSKPFAMAEKFQDEHTPFAPNSPYGVAKLAAHHLVRVYREAYGIFACAGILYNHESSRRSPEFVTRKITRHVADVVRGRTEEVLRLGNVEACRDWGHARDYVRAMHLMVTAERPSDYVVATGETHTVEEFARLAFSAAGLEPCWVSDPTLFRPCEVPYLRGDASHVRAELGWSPSVPFGDLVREMVEADLAR